MRSFFCGGEGRRGGDNKLWQREHSKWQWGDTLGYAKQKVRNGTNTSNTCDFKPFLVTILGSKEHTTRKSC